MCLKSYQNSYELIVLLNKNHKFFKEIWYFETPANTVSINTPQISRIFFDVLCPKIAFFHSFWLKCHEKRKRYNRKTPVLGLFVNKVTALSVPNIFKWNSGTGAFLWIYLSFTEHLFVEHLRMAVSVIFLSSFVMSGVVRQCIS